MRITRLQQKVATMMIIQSPLADNVSEVKPLQKPVTVWLQQQRKQYRNGTMTHDRSERLKQAGYLPNA